VLADDPEGIGFEWNQAFGVEGIARAVAALPDIALRREIRTPLYRILLYQRLAPGQRPEPAELLTTERMGRLTPAAAEPARWPGRAAPAVPDGPAASVPILMYHRVAADGPAGLDRFRVHPALFAEHVAALHEAGYRTVRLRDWARAMARREPLRGKPVILTFDDGYRDILDGAIPALRRHGFRATVFPVAERVGHLADWDVEFGAAAPLLGWDELRALQAAEVEFGCHSCRHRPMTGMGMAELAEDLTRARAILEEALGCPVTTLAYPYGAENEVVRRVVAELGFAAAVTCRPGVARLHDSPLRLPRLEVEGGCRPETLLARIDAALAATATTEP
jgi:peptidoglycan/xylan/chitin deacetylase (PgdA/CDA1 family)